MSLAEHVRRGAARAAEAGAGLSAAVFSAAVTGGAFGPGPEPGPGTAGQAGPGAGAGQWGSLHGDQVASLVLEDVESVVGGGMIGAWDGLGGHVPAGLLAVACLGLIGREAEVSSLAALVLALLQVAA